MIVDLLVTASELMPITASLAIAFVVFFVIALPALRTPKKSHLDLRATSLSSQPKQAGNAVAAQLNFLRRMERFLPLDRFRQQITDWFTDRLIVGEQKRLRLVQAGYRQPRTYFYFEIMRALFGVTLGAISLFALQMAGIFATNFTLGAALGFLALMLSLYLPNIYLGQRIAARRRAFAEYWDDALGLLIICLDAGLSIELAMRRIAQELAATAPVVAEELTITVTDLALLTERRLAYLGLSKRIDVPSVKSVTIALIQAEKQGASIANSLRSISKANRDARVTAAEEKAASLGPKMTVPMIVFFLPVIFVIIMAPMAMKAMQ